MKATHSSSWLTLGLLGGDTHDDALLLSRDALPDCKNSSFTNPARDGFCYSIVWLLTAAAFAQVSLPGTDNIACSVVLIQVSSLNLQGDRGIPEACLTMLKPQKILLNMKSVLALTSIAFVLIFRILLFCQVLCPSRTKPPPPLPLLEPDWRTPLINAPFLKGD